MTIEYKIKEIALEPLQTLIVKTGGEVEFTLGKMEDDVLYLEKAKKEVVAQVSINKATMENVARTHPHIAAMTREDLTAAFLYREAMGVVTMGTEKLEEIQKQLDDYSAEKVEIIKQTGINLPEANVKETGTTTA